jgi:omega-amidase
VRGLIDKARLPPNALVVLPEMFATGFTMNAAYAAEPYSTGPTFVFLASIAKDFGVYILAGISSTSDSFVSLSHPFMMV